MPAENTPPLIQYLRLRSGRGQDFGPRLALAIHRQSTTHGFLGSMEGSVMAEADTWTALIAWATAEDADRSTRGLFESDYHADFATRVKEVEANHLFAINPETLEGMRGSRTASFARIERFEMPPNAAAWATFLSRRKHLLHTMEGFEDVFAFSALPDSEENRNGIVSTWNDSRLLRAAAEEIEAQYGPGDFRPETQETIRITSSNL